MSGLVPPSDPKADLRPFMQAVADAITQLQRPGQPSPVYPAPSTDLPPAANWPDCVLRVSDLKILAVSDGVAWIRQDTGAAI